VSDTLRRVAELVRARDVLISARGYDEMAEDSILASDVIDGVAAAVLVEDYPDYPKGRPATGPERQSDPRCLGHPERADVASCAGHGISARSGPLDGRFPAEEAMNKRRHTKLVREGTYAAEVDVELVDAVDGWSPYLSLDDAYRLDAVREALRRGDIQAATHHARVFSLTPISR
jgi:hypothetical protein